MKGVVGEMGDKSGFGRSLVRCLNTGEWGILLWSSVGGMWIDSVGFLLRCCLAWGGGWVAG